MYVYRQLNQWRNHRSSIDGMYIIINIRIINQSECREKSASIEILFCFDGGAALRSWHESAMKRGNRHCAYLAYK